MGQTRAPPVILLFLLQLLQFPWFATSLIQPVGATSRFQNEIFDRNRRQGKRFLSPLFQSSSSRKELDIEPETTSADVEGSPFEQTALGTRNGRGPSIRSSPRVEYLIFAIPIFTGLGAFMSYHPLLVTFSGFCNFLSQHMALFSTAVGDGGALLNPPGVRSVLGGPVVTSIAILFGTLVAGTISTLVDRNGNLLSAGIAMGEEIRTARLHLETFSPTYRDKANRLLDDFHRQWLLDFGNERMTLVTIRRLTPYLDDCMRLIHTARNDKGETLAGISDASSSIQRIREKQRDAMLQINRGFPWVHYANLAVLGCSICIIFLIDSSLDKNNLVATEPQLAMGWSLLVGTLTMLTIVISDAASLFSSITRSLRETRDVDLDEMALYTKGVNIGDKQTTE